MTALTGAAAAGAGARPGCDGVRVARLSDLERKVRMVNGVEA
jgi:hypothetical protein